MLKCEECGAIATDIAEGWRAILVDFPDDLDGPEIVIFCLDCAVLEFGPHAPHDSPSQR